MINTSGFGFHAVITATNTFPSGFSGTEFADDADPFDSPDVAAADTAMGLNGDMIVWTRAAGIEISLNVIPLSPFDLNLETLLEANRVSKGKKGARDIVSLVGTYPDGRVFTGNPGVIVTGSVMPSIASSSRIKTRRYMFRFEQIAKSAS